MNGVRLSTPEEKTSLFVFLDEGANCLVRGTEQLLDLSRRAVTKPYPDDLGWIGLEHAALGKVRVLGDDREPM
jgi:hypothetical protein